MIIKEARPLLSPPLVSMELEALTIWRAYNISVNPRYKLPRIKFNTDKIFGFKENCHFTLFFLFKIGFQILNTKFLFLVLLFPLFILSCSVFSYLISRTFRCSYIVTRSNREKKIYLFVIDIHFKAAAWWTLWRLFF